MVYGVGCRVQGVGCRVYVSTPTEAVSACVPDYSKRTDSRGLVFQAHRLLYHSTLGLRVITKKKKTHQQVIILLPPIGPKNGSQEPTHACRGAHHTLVGV